MAKKITIYGIKNCDTMKKTFAWFEKKKIPYTFHDYKKEGADMALLQKVEKKFGWEEMLNRKGTTWRRLPEKERDSMTTKRAFKVAEDNPSIIRRPIIVSGAKMVLGFDEEKLQSVVKK